MDLPVVDLDNKEKFLSSKDLRMRVDEGFIISEKIKYL